MRFINIDTHKPLFSIGSRDDGITTAAVSPNGRYVVTVMNNGGINIYCTRSLTREVNKVALNFNTRSYVMAKKNVCVYVLCGCYPRAGPTPSGGLDFWG